MAVLTGPNKDAQNLRYPLPSGTPHRVIAATEIMVRQHEQVVHVELEQLSEDHNVLVVTHDLGSLKGRAFSDALAALADAINDAVDEATERHVSATA